MILSNKSKKIIAKVYGYTKFNKAVYTKFVKEDWKVLVSRFLRAGYALKIEFVRKK